MPRSRGNSAYVPSRMIKHSGATFVTRPSGVTIQKNNIQTTGVTLAGSNAQSSYGYPIHIGSAAVKVRSGVTSIPAGTKAWTAANLGLTTLTNIIASPSGSATPMPIMLSFVKTTDAGATVSAFDKAGVTVTSAISINYFAFGT